MGTEACWTATNISTVPFGYAPNDPFRVLPERAGPGHVGNLLEGAPGPAVTVDLVPPAERADAQQTTEPNRPSRVQSWIRHLICGLNGLLTVAVFVGVFFGNDFRVSDWDPTYMRDLVERSMRYGGSFYVNGIHNKGPLEPVVYRLAATLSSWDSYWYAVTVFVLIGSTVVALCAAYVTRTTSGHWSVGFATGMAVLIHLTLSGAEYSGRLYSRHMTVALLCAVFILMLDRGTWEGLRRIRPNGAAVLVGAMLGLTVQTLVTSALSASVLAVSGFWLMSTAETALRDRIRRFTVMVGAAAVTFAAAPLWYLARGMWGIFWNSWWVYGTYMTKATDRGLGDQFGLGWHTFYLYYQERPLAFLAIVAFLSLTMFEWRGMSQPDRAMRVAIAGWWLCACVEITLTQRYSGHYFVATTVPNMLMASALVGTLMQRLMRLEARRRHAPLITLVVIVVSLYFSPPTQFVTGLRMARDFRGFADVRARMRSADDLPTQTVRAVLDSVSDPNDPLLMWTNEPWPYERYHRVSATRFIWKSFLMGEIYLGRTSPDFVLPGSWSQWRADLRQSRPVVYLEETSNPMDDGTEADRYIRQNFTTIYDDGANRIALRNDVASRFVSAATAPKEADGWTANPAILHSAWITSPGQAHVDTGDQATAEALPVSTHGCFRLDGRIAAPGRRRGTISFRFTDSKGRRARHLTLTEDSASSENDNGGTSQSHLAIPGTDPLDFSLVVSANSALLLSDGRVRAALSIPTDVVVTLESRSPAVALEHLVMTRLSSPRRCLPTPPTT